ncbi:MAG: DNA polymerase III subunit delta [Candidatus Caenarcaniphilales bacterium]|nr:DNA polymerase III subunit delta [Candidatus Caenarcaniphilales bacterium]
MEKQSIHLIFGDDEFRVSQKIKELKNESLSSKNDTTCHRVNPKDDLFTEIFGISLFSQNKLLILNLPDFDSNELLKILESDSIPQHIELIIYQSGKLDKRTKLFKFLDKASGKVFEINQFSPWKPNDVTNWLKMVATSKNINIEQKALQKMVNFYGNDTASLNSEMDRLASYVNNEIIKLEDVEKLCDSHEDLFSVVECILKKQLGLASQKAEKYINHQSPLPLIAGLQTIFRSYFIIKELDSEGINPPEIAAKIGKNPWKVSQDVLKLQKVRIDFLGKIIKTLNQIEFEIKTGANSNPISHFKFRVLSLNEAF